MHHTVSAADLKAWLHDGAEIALLDVREHGQYGWAHPFHAVPLPYSRLEIDIARLVPRRDTRIVVHDSGTDDVAGLAAKRLAAAGYTRVHVLEGGTAAWQAAGNVLFAGVNVPSKTFGEMAEETYHTPHISAGELAERQARGDNLIVLDGRPVEEYRKMTIPGSICCPNGELPLRIAALAPDPATTIVVNCAGRTRSIIGAQTLRHFGVPNPVLALENGTQGWFLAGLTLDHGADRLYPPAPVDLAEARERAARHAQRCGVPFVDAAALADPARTTFLCDVRTPAEYAAGSLPGAQNAPGGQLLQATDQYVGVRGARIVVFDAEGVRAPMVAAWLRQMGWDACVLRDGIAAQVPPVAVAPTPTMGAPALAMGVPTLATGAPALAMGAQALAMGAPIDTAGLAALMGKVALVDLRPGMAYRAGHLRGATWAIRPRMDGITESEIVLIAPEEGIAALAAIDLAERGIRVAHWHNGTPAQWKAAGLPMEATPDVPTDADCIDYLFFVHDRHAGNREAAQQYLAWELGLVAQLDAQDRAAWRFLAS